MTHISDDHAVRRMPPLWTIMLVVMLMGLSFLLGRISSSLRVTDMLLPPTDASGEHWSLKQEMDGFESFVQQWNRYIETRDGFVPSDPYRALIDAGIVDSYASLRCISFEPWLPPRLNPDLSRNPRLLVLAEE